MADCDRCREKAPRGVLPFSDFLVVSFCFFSIMELFIPEIPEVLASQRLASD